MTVVVVYLTYGERKIVARFQQRLGPTRTGPAGLLQGFADALKLVTKEDLRPTNADRWVFELAPFMTFIPVFMVLVVAALRRRLGRPQPGPRRLLRLRRPRPEIVGIMMAGLGSGNKYALLGGVRAAAQMISYEIPLVLALLAVVMVAHGTIDASKSTAPSTCRAHPPPGVAAFHPHPAARLPHLLHGHAQRTPPRAVRHSRGRVRDRRRLLRRVLRHPLEHVPAYRIRLHLGFQHLRLGRLPRRLGRSRMGSDWGWALAARPHRASRAFSSSPSSSGCAPPCRAFASTSS